MSGGGCIHRRDGMENLLESSVKRVDSDKLKAVSESVMGELIAAIDCCKARGPEDFE